MSLRCLIFSSNEPMVQPIWQVLTDLGIEGEYCNSAVDAVERVTTQQFQIVITDWDDQPEAAFLLKTARDLKAAQRPLTLAIVSDDARLPEALKAGANSVLLKPLRAEQVRDTMSTACQLLRAKQQPAAQRPVAQATATAAPPAQEAATMAAAAGVAPTSVPPPVPSPVPSPAIQPTEKTFRAGEFLPSASSAPGAQFDTEKEGEVQKSLDEAAAAEVDVLTELEPMASAVEDAPAEPAEPIEPQTPLTGWAALQARLTRTAPPPAEEAPAKSELLSYGQTPSHGAPPAESPAEEGKDSANKESQPESGSEAALFAYMPGESAEGSEPAAKPRSKRGRILLAGILAAASVVLVGVPRARLSLRGGVKSAVRAGKNWLNPPPAPVPQAAPQHDSFGQSGDEYNLPVPANIPDATTDPSQIRVLPVVDPTAKPDKNAGANSGQTQTATDDNNQSDPNQAGQSQTGPGQNQNEPIPGGKAQSGDGQVKDPSLTKTADVPGNAATAGEPSAAPPQPDAPAAQAVPPQPRPSAPPAPKPVPHTVSAASNVGIPSSLKSQMASSTPDASGNKPPEAAMSSIEPVTLTESAARDLLTQPVDPVYPDAAKAAGQRGSVVLQVLIGRDGAVQDAKFLQGSLVFARAAIDAVKQWHFKPYSMNGRAVSAQTVITLKFQPPS
jgi:periplasmic protein TonB